MTHETLFERIPNLNDLTMVDHSSNKLDDESFKTLHVIKQYIEKTCSVKQIILFGSRAQGKYREDSDYDLLLVTEKFLETKEKRKLANKIIADLSRQKIDVDILVKNREELVEISEKPFSIVKSAIETGMLL
jgi:predicted nucleotidyltransferase